MFFVNLLNKDGDFELIDGDLLPLYPNLNADELVEISEEQYSEFCQNDNGSTKFIGGKFQFEKTPENPTALLAARKAELLRQIATKTDQLKARYLAGYSQAEIDSFYRQEQEARGELPTMLLDELLAGRDDVPDMATLKAKVIAKADTFAIIMGKTFAVKQNFEGHIERATTWEELEKISQEIEQWA